MLYIKVPKIQVSFKEILYNILERGRKLICQTQIKSDTRISRLGWKLSNQSNQLSNCSA